MNTAVESWKKVGNPGSYSSAELLAATQKKKLSQVKNDLKKSVLFQAHRDLQERFTKRALFSTSFGEIFSSDIGDFGSKIPPELSGLPYLGRRKQLLMLVVVDAFSDYVFARGVKSKDKSEIEHAFQSIFAEIRESGLVMPALIITDEGGEYVSKSFKKLCETNNIKHNIAKGLHKAQLAEKTIKSLKKVIMGAVQSGKYPKQTTWNEMVKIAAESLNRRYNQAIKTTPAQAVSANSAPVRKLRWSKEDFVPYNRMIDDEKSLRNGGAITELGTKWKIGTLVLTPIQKTRRGKVKDKDYAMHYNLMFGRISKIFHARNPYLYEVEDARTGKKRSRLYYGKELKQIELPSSIDPENVVDCRVTRAEGLQYKLTSGEWKNVS